MALDLTRKRGEEINIADDTIRIKLLEIYSGSSTFRITTPASAVLSVEIFSTNHPPETNPMPIDRIKLRDVFRNSHGQNAVEFDIDLHTRENLKIALETGETVKFGHGIKKPKYGQPPCEIRTFTTAPDHIPVHRQEVLDQAP